MERAEDDVVLWVLMDCVQMVRSLCSLWFMITKALMSRGWPKSKRLRWKLKSRTRRNPIPTTKKQPIRHSIDITTQAGFDFYTETGLFIDQFESLFTALEEDLRQPRRGLKGNTRATLMEPRTRLVMVLNWLREGGKYRRLMRAYGLPNRALISREIHHIIPILCGYLHEIAWPPNLLPHPFEGVVGAIDCTSHFRNRVHPRQADYYRGDKHAFFLSAQVVCGLNGIIYDVKIVLGHNNDQGALSDEHAGHVRGKECSALGGQWILLLTAYHT